MIYIVYVVMVFITGFVYGRYVYDAREYYDHPPPVLVALFWPLALVVTVCLWVNGLFIGRRK